jgi:anti-anti-sigma factor
MAGDTKAWLDGGKVIVFYSKRLVIKEAVIFRDLIRALTAEGFKDVIVDLSACSYIDSAGIAELVVAFTHCRREGGSLALNNLPPKIHTLLRITQLLTVFDCFAVEYPKHLRMDVSAENLSALKKAVSLSKMDALTFLLTLQQGNIQVLPGAQQGIYKLPISNSSQGELIVASPYVIANATRSFLRQEIEEFEYLINAERTNEHDIQKFLEAHPKFLLGQKYQTVHSQVILDREKQGSLIPDFLLQPFGKQFCDIVDLKLPGAPVIVGGQNRMRFSSAIAEAAAQLRTYRDYFDDASHRNAVLKKNGVSAYRPKLAVFVGRSSSLDEMAYRQVSDGLTDVEVVTYDDLIDRAKNFLLL